ncbi:MAG TPA: glycosyltransferase family 39 protein [Microbacteriaceae bacterium]
MRDLVTPAKPPAPGLVAAWPAPEPRVAPAPTSAPRRAQRRDWLLPVCFGLFATLVSMLGSWIPSLWEDEAASLLSARRPLGSLFMMLGHIDAVHGTYYLGLHAWIDVFGGSPFSIRFPSAIGIGLCAAAVVVLVRRLRSTRTAIIAGLVCAFLPRLTYAGEEARSYAFSAAIAAWLTVLLLELLARSRPDRTPPDRTRPNRMLWVAYAALLALGIYCFLYVGLMVAAHAVIVLWQRPGRRFVAVWALSAAVGIAAAVPIGVWAFLERSQISYLATRQQLTPDSILVGLWFGYSAAAIVGWALIVIAVGATAVAAVQLRRRRHAGDDVPSARPGTRQLPSLELVASCWLFIPAVLLIVPGTFIAAFSPRYLTLCAPAAAILIACGIARLAALKRLPDRRRTLVAVIATGVVLAAMVPAYLVQRGPYAKNNSDWAEISAVVGAHATPGDAVLFDHSVPQSRRPELALHTYPAGFTGLQNVLLKTPNVDNISWSDTMYSVAQAIALGRFTGVTRAWLVEYSTPAHTDSWGLTALRALGFTPVGHYRTFGSEIIELSR